MNNTEEKFLRTLDAISRREAKAMNPQLHYTLKSSYLSSLEYDLMQMRIKLNALHTIEKNASVSELNELEEMDKMHLEFLSSVQRFRAEVEPFLK